MERTYNQLPHSALGDRSPNEVLESSEAVWDEMYEDAVTAAHQRGAGVEDERRVLSVGDRVRRADNLKRKNALSKGADPSWSEEIYTVAKVHKPTERLKEKAVGEAEMKGSVRFVHQYELRDSEGDKVKGRFPAYDLQRITRSEKAPAIERDEAKDRRRAAEAERKQGAAERKREETKQRRAEAKRRQQEEATGREAAERREIERELKGKRVFDPDQPEDDFAAAGVVLGGAERRGRKWSIRVAYPMDSDDDGEGYLNPVEGKGGVRQAVKEYAEAEQERRRGTEAKPYPSAKAAYADGHKRGDKVFHYVQGKGKGRKKRQLRRRLR